MTRGTAKDVCAVVSAAGEIVGRTRLQKTISLLEMAGVGYGFSFEYYKFGPYSDELVVSIDRAVDLKYISEDERRASWGGRYSIFKSNIIQSTGNQARDEIITIARDADAIALELSVTAAFLAKEGSPEPWVEVRRRKSEKATLENMRNAAELLEKFKSVNNLPVPLPNIAKI